MKKWIGLAVALMLGGGMAFANTSAENRKESFLLIGHSPFGGDIPTMLTSNAMANELKNVGMTNVTNTPLVTLGIYTSRSMLVGLDYGAMSASYTDTASGVTGTLGYSNIGAYLRWFPGNSFNFLLAAHQRTWTLAGKASVTDPLLGSVNLDTSLTAAAMVGTVGIGNQWLTDFGLVIGIDWLAFSGVLSSTSTATFKGTGTDPISGATIDLTSMAQSTTDQALTQMTDAGKALNLIAGAPGIIIVTIGWSF